MRASLQTSRRVLPLHQSPQARPTTVSGVYRAAARLLAVNGLYKGDFVPDAFDREMDVPHFLRPMSIVAALKCVTTGDPHRTSLLADEAIAVLALRLEVDGEGPLLGGIFDLEAHVDAWGDVESRTTESAVAVLEGAADVSEVAA
ncbi:hypothetical protein ACIO02_35350 [Streptomyces sp. NPDC087568]|uniref:DUF6197 family protein n=1 Tax=Streptomyces sp. NPDC087568 TaxID=3365799 RepID=UPI0037FA659B